MKLNGSRIQVVEFWVSVPVYFAACAGLCCLTFAGMIAIREVIQLFSPM